MKLFWKGVAAVLIAGSAMTVSAAPAQAQYYNDGGWRGEWRGDRHDRWDRRDHYDRRDRYDGRRNWRGDDARYYRGHYRGRERCWTERRYDPYRDRRVKVRICR
jgi:Ni/Co efflux regulator RcnB